MSYRQPVSDLFSSPSLETNKQTKKMMNAAGQPQELVVKLKEDFVKATPDKIRPTTEFMSMRKPLPLPSTPNGKGEDADRSRKIPVLISEFAKTIEIPVQPSSSGRVATTSIMRLDSPSF